MNQKEGGELPGGNGGLTERESWAPGTEKDKTWEADCLWALGSRINNVFYYTSSIVVASIHFYKLYVQIL